MATRGGVRSVAISPENHWLRLCHSGKRRQAFSTKRRAENRLCSHPYRGAGRQGGTLPTLPSSAYPLEEGLHRALPSMPPQVAAFLLYVPRDPPPWRYQESEVERAQREMLESEGAWTG